MIKVVVFDFDGVLVESMDVKTSAFARLFEDEGADVVSKVVDYHLKNGGVSRFEKFEYIYREVLRRPLVDEKKRELGARFSNMVLEEVLRQPYVTGAQEFLERGFAKYRFYIASATPQEELDEIVQRRGMAHFFRGVYGAPRKKGEIVGLIMEKEKYAARDLVFVGDALSDLQAAEQNAIAFVARVSTKGIFDEINCRKLPDLTRLGAVIEELDHRE